MSQEAPVTDRLAALFSDGWDRIIAILTRLTGDRELAQECAQDAFTSALVRWKADGVPDKPIAWLTTAARNRALDRTRRASVEAGKLRELADKTAREPPPTPRAGVIPNDRLELMFGCAHPALATGAQIALILSCLTCLSTPEIAAAFLVSDRAMRQRVFRAKQRLRQARIPFGLPAGTSLPERLPAVLWVLFLLFNSGYEGLGDSGPVRRHLADDAIQLCRIVAGLVPDEPEALGLLALMLLHDARRDAHVPHHGSPDAAAPGEFLALAEQDRSRWDRAKIDEGRELARRALSAGRPGMFQIQAAIAACHDSAPAAGATDWREISLLYRQLARQPQRRAVALNQALAVGLADSPEAGLLIVIDPPDAMGDFALPPATRAARLRRAGRLAEATDACYEALDLAAPIALGRAGIPAVIPHTPRPRLPSEP